MKQTNLSCHFRKSKPVLPQKRKVPEEGELATKDFPTKIQKTQLQDRIAALKGKVPATRQTTGIVDQDPELRSKADIILSRETGRARYADLLSNPLPLPTRFNTLLRVFDALEAALRFNTLRKETTTFEEVKYTIATTRSLRVTEEHLQQILHLWPQAYTVSWIEQNKIFRLVAAIPISNKKSNDARRTIFRDKLLALVASHHAQWLQTLPSQPVVELINLKKWDEGFDLESVPDIPKAELPEHPVIENGPRSFAKILTSGAQMKDMIQEVMSRTNSSLKLPERKETPSQSETAKPKSMINNSLLEKIRAKERQNIQAKLSIEDTEQIQRRAKVEKLQQTLSSLLALFAMHRQPSIFLDIIINKIQSSRRVTGADTRHAVIKDLVLEVVQMFPNSLHLHQTNSGEALRISDLPSFSESIAKQTILSKYNV